MLLDILSAILLPVRRNGSERRMKWSGFCFLVFLFFFLFPLPPLHLSADFISMVARAVAARPTRLYI